MTKPYFPEIVVAKPDIYNTLATARQIILKMRENRVSEDVILSFEKDFFRYAGDYEETVGFFRQWVTL